MYYVCVNAGLFDIVLYEANSSIGAEQYLNLINPLTSNISFEIKQNVRRLQETFVSDDILIGVSVI